MTVNMHWVPRRIRQTKKVTAKATSLRLAITVSFQPNSCTCKTSTSGWHAACCEAVAGTCHSGAAHFEYCSAVQTRIADFHEDQAGRELGSALHAASERQRTAEESHAGVCSLSSNSCSQSEKMQQLTTLRKTPTVSPTIVAM